MEYEEQKSFGWGTRSSASIRARQQGRNRQGELFSQLDQSVTKKFKAVAGCVHFGNVPDNVSPPKLQLTGPPRKPWAELEDDVLLEKVWYGKAAPVEGDDKSMNDEGEGKNSPVEYDDKNKSGQELACFLLGVFSLSSCGRVLPE